MDILKIISIDIVKYLQEQKGQSIDDIAKYMSTSSTHIQKIINKEAHLTSENLNYYLKNQNIKLWEFVLKAVPINHLTPKSREKILICKKLSDHVKKIKKKS